MRKKFLWLEDKNVRIIFQTLLKGSTEVYAVGGCVRNELLHRPINDIDLATNLKPKNVMNLVTKAGFSCAPTGIAYGTVTVTIGGQKFQVTTFRSDIQTDGRYAKVLFSDNIRADALRRDFTINAIYVTFDGKVIDPLVGYSDLLKGKVKFIGEPKKRISEDYLRILRFFRFSVLYGNKNKGIDADGLLACKSNLLGLKMISKERIWYEFRQILGARDPVEILLQMDRIGVLSHIFAQAKTKFLTTLRENEVAIDIKPNAIIRLLMLNISVSDEILSVFPINKSDRIFLKSLLKCLKENISCTIAGFYYGEFVALGATLISRSAKGEKVTISDVEQIRFGSTQIFPLNGLDLLNYYNASKILGEELKKLKLMWIESNFKLSKCELLKSLTKEKL